MPKITLFLLLALLTVQCNNRQPIEDGTYVGTFTVRYDNSTQSGAVSLRLNNGSYTCSANTNRIPAGGFGTFSVQGNELVFVDSGAYTADFDWNLILDDPYQYTFNGRRLTLSADKNGVGNYRYELEKQ